MTLHCQNCGAELVEGQRFCRQCGADVRATGEAELPTRIFPSAATPTTPAPGVPFDTSRLPESHTNPVYQPRQTAQQPYGPQPTSYSLPVPQQQPPPQPHSRTWLYILASLCVIAVMFISVLIFASQHNSTDQPQIIIKKNLPPPAPPPAPSSMGQPGAVPLAEDGAEVTGDKTTITRSYPVQRGAAVSLKNVSGNIEVEAWDQDQAEVTVIKHGGSPQEREAVRIQQISAQNKLSLETPLVGNSHVEVEYQLKLPRSVAALAISSLKSDVKLSGIVGSIAVDLQKGSIELEDVGGAIRAKTIKGDIEAEMEGTKLTGPQEFNTVKGNIELQFDGDVNAEVQADTTDGDIEMDDDFNLHVSKQPVGQHVAGRVGHGGPPLSARTVNGNIKLKK